jgi:hypothetical protein
MYASNESSGATAVLTDAPRGADSLLEIEPKEFRQKFTNTPFTIGHKLCEHPLFELDSLMELGKRLPESCIEYNAGNIPVSIEQKLTPRNGLSAQETIRRIAECKSWMVLKYVENDPAYRAMLEQCLAGVRPFSEPIAPGMRKPHGFIFISSPGSITPYHADPEHNFLLQIRGNKIVHQFDARDRSVLSEQELERFYSEHVRNLTFNEEYREKAWVFDLQPGEGLHFPVTYPHFVQNGAEVSISFSITFRTPDLDRRTAAYQFNAGLRKRGLTPCPVGKSAWRDSLKYQTMRVWRKAAGMFSKQD